MSSAQTAWFFAMRSISWGVRGGPKRPSGRPVEPTRTRCEGGGGTGRDPAGVGSHPPFRRNHASTAVRPMSNPGTIVGAGCRPFRRHPGSKSSRDARRFRADRAVISGTGRRAIGFPAELFNLIIRSGRSPGSPPRRPSRRPATRGPMIRLPIDPILPEIVSAGPPSRRCLVLVAPPGAGKTTRVPAALVEAGLLAADHPALVLLQPRRVAARAAAARIAEENGWALGEAGRLPDPLREADRARDPDPGRHRGHPQPPARRRPVPRRRRRGGPRRVPRAEPAHRPGPRPAPRGPRVGPRRPDPGRDVGHDGRRAGRGVPGRCRRSSGSRGGPSRSRSAIEGLRPPRSPIGWPRPIEEAVADEARPRRRPGLPARGRGDPPGGPAAGPLGGPRRASLVLPLHGSLPAEEQDRALRPADRRKVILATNIAETSLTIDGRRHGDRRRPGPVRQLRPGPGARPARTGPDQPGLGRPAGRPRRADPPRPMRPALVGARASRAARLRRARGPPRRPLRDRPRPPRLGPPRPRPVRLVRAPRSRRARPPPPSGCWCCSGPSTAKGGDHAARPAAPRRARPSPARPAPDRRGADRGLLREGAALAALLSEKDILRPELRPRCPARGPRRSDLLIRLDRLDEAERARFAPALRDRGIDPTAARQVARVRDDLLRVGRQAARGRDPPEIEPDEDDAPPADPPCLSRPGRPPAGGRRLDRRDGRRAGGPARPRVGRPRRRILPGPRPQGGPSRRDAGGPGPGRQRDPARNGSTSFFPARSAASGPSGSTRNGGGSWASRPLSYRDLAAPRGPQRPGRSRGGRPGARRGPGPSRPRDLRGRRSRGRLARPARPRRAACCPRPTGPNSTSPPGPT